MKNIKVKGIVIILIIILLIFGLTIGRKMLILSDLRKKFKICNFF